MDPIQISTVENAILNNLLTGNISKFINVVKPIGTNDYTGANLFGDGRIDQLLTDSLNKFDAGVPYTEAFNDLTEYIKTASTITPTINAQISTLNDKVDQLSKLINYSVDGSSKEFQDGKELAKSEPGKSKDELDIACSKKGLDGQDAVNFKFGYNSVDKKAPNIGSGDSKIDQNHSEFSFSFKDLKQKYASIWSKIMAIGSMLDSISTSSSDEARSESEAEALEKLKLLVSDPKDWSAIAYNVLGLSVSPSEYNVFSEVKNMSNDDKVKDAVKGKVTGTYKWSKDGSTLAVIGVSEDEFNTWKELVKDVLGDEVTVIGVKDPKDLPSNIQFCDESTNIEYSEDPNKYYSNKSEFASTPSPAAAKLTRMVNGDRDPSLTGIVEQAAKLRMKLGVRGNMEDIWITLDEAVRNNPKRTRKGWIQEYLTGLEDLVDAFKNMNMSESSESTIDPVEKLKSLKAEMNTASDARKTEIRDEISVLIDQLPSKINQSEFSEYRDETFPPGYIELPSGKVVPPDSPLAKKYKEIKKKMEEIRSKPVPGSTKEYDKLREELKNLSEDVTKDTNPTDKKDMKDTFEGKTTGGNEMFNIQEFAEAVLDAANKLDTKNPDEITEYLKENTKFCDQNYSQLVQLYSEKIVDTEEVDETVNSSADDLFEHRKNGKSTADFDDDDTTTPEAKENDKKVDEKKSTEAVNHSFSVSGDSDRYENLKNYFRNDF